MVAGFTVWRSTVLAGWQGRSIYWTGQQCAGCSGAVKGILEAVVGVKSAAWLKLVSFAWVSNFGVSSLHHRSLFVWSNWVSRLLLVIEATHIHRSNSMRIWDTSGPFITRLFFANSQLAVYFDYAWSAWVLFLSLLLFIDWQHYLIFGAIHSFLVFAFISVAVCRERIGIVRKSTERSRLIAACTPYITKKTERISQREIYSQGPTMLRLCQMVGTVDWWILEQWSQ